MNVRSLPLAIAMSLALGACSQEGGETAAVEKETSAAAASTPVDAADAENARLEAIRQDCLKRPPAQGAAAPPMVDGLYRIVPRDKTYSSAWWLSNKTVVLLNEPRDGAAETATLSPQTWVQVAEDVAFTVPTRGIVLRARAGGDLKACDIVYLVDSEDGEGASTKWVWGQGKVFTLDQNDGPASEEDAGAPYIEWEWPESESAPLSPAANTRLGQWVRVKGPSGVAGWVRGGLDDFDCIWENDRYLDDKPTKCATFPGAGVKP